MPYVRLYTHVGRIKSASNQDDLPHQVQNLMRTKEADEVEIVNAMENAGWELKFMVACRQWSDNDKELWFLKPRTP